MKFLCYNLFLSKIVSFFNFLKNYLNKNFISTVKVEGLRKMKKLVTILVVCILLGTIIGIYVPIERVEAADPEIHLDQNLIKNLQEYHWF